MRRRRRNILVEATAVLATTGAAAGSPAAWAQRRAERALRIPEKQPR